MKIYKLTNMMTENGFKKLKLSIKKIHLRIITFKNKIKKMMINKLMILIIFMILNSKCNKEKRRNKRVQVKKILKIFFYKSYVNIWSNM